MKTVPLRSRTTAQVAAEWDQMAPIRARQLKRGIDHSALHVLGPAISTLVGRAPSIVDVGCGTGWLTNNLSNRADKVIGVDPSHASIALARHAVKKENVSFVNASIEEYVKTNQLVFSIAVANMTLGTVSSLSGTLRAIKRSLAANGHLVFTVAHPCFWPIYWGYAEAPWFRYGNEIAVAAPFRISAEGTAMVTTHVHRPLEQYFAVLRSTGFDLEEFQELTGEGFALPRFIAIRCMKL